VKISGKGFLEPYLYVRTLGQVNAFHKAHLAAVPRHYDGRGARAIAKETGGMTFFPFKASDLTQSFENIANELRSQYALTYRPDPLQLDGLYHPVEIKIKGRKELSVRTRKGYYSPRS